MIVVSIVECIKLRDIPPFSKGSELVNTQSQRINKPSLPRMSIKQKFVVVGGEYFLVYIRADTLCEVYLSS